MIKVSDAKSAARLVERIAAGDRRAEEELVERYYRGISFLIHREVGDYAAAEDLCQETFRIALEKLKRGEVREPEKLLGFICHLAHNLVIAHFRQVSRRANQDGLEAAKDLPDPAPSQIEQLLQKERDEIVRQVVRELKSPRDRQVLFRFYLAEDDKERIGADLGLTVPQLNLVLFRARQRCKELYEKLVSQSGSGSGRQQGRPE
jgi:RNA polymerase sigma-70 factor (ECF subfamily)